MFLVVVAICLLSAIAVAIAVYVDDPTVFELEGDALNSASYDGDDWANAAGTGSGLTGAAVTTTATNSPAGFPFVIPDVAGTTIFTQGGSKDHNDISSWRHSTGSVPDKNEITNAYAAAYIIGGELWIYFGMDRFANDGTANVGFWFFQQNVGPITTGVNAGKFTGAHTAGDLLVVSEFTQGGAVTTIKVYEWVGTGGDQHQGTTNLKFASAAAECDLNNPSKIVCGKANTTTQIAPWPYSPKSGAAQTFPVASFFEGGINISQVLGTSNAPCFSSFLANTRSSTTISAVLKDFVSGGFPVCGVTITKSCTGAAVNSSGTSIHYTFNGTVTNTGVGTLYDVLVTDSFPSGATNTVLNQPTIPATGLAAGAANAVTYTGSFDHTSASGLTNSATVAAAPFSGGTAADRTVTDTATWNGCSATPSPGLTLGKACSVSVQPASGKLVIQVDVTGQVCNTGNTQISGITVTDNQIGTILSNVTLGPQVGSTPTCQSFPSGTSYQPSVCSTPANGGTCAFTDTVSASGTSSLGGATVTAPNANATCHLCPAGVCAATSP